MPLLQMKQRCFVFIEIAMRSALADTLAPIHPVPASSRSTR